MAKALWVSGGSYQADEDRKLIAACFRTTGTGGVISGLTVAPGTGLQVTVSAGFFVINDGASGAYLSYTTTTTPVTISGNTSGTTRSDTVYAAVDPTTGNPSFGVAAGTTTLPANSTRLATVSVANGAASLTAANITNNPGVVNSGGPLDTRYLRKDVADVLYAGTTASTPVNPNEVAIKNYVDRYSNDTGYVGLTLHSNLTGLFEYRRMGHTLMFYSRVFATNQTYAGDVWVVSLPAGLWPSGTIYGAADVNDGGGSECWRITPSTGDIHLVSVNRSGNNHWSFSGMFLLAGL